MKKRNVGIELYRCLLMFGICMIHAAGFYAKEWHWLSSAFCWCVDGFVLISGYFGCPFKPSKILRFYATAIACSVLACQVPMVLELGYSASFWGFLVSVRDHLWYNWFISAYVGMLMIAPVIDAAIERLKVRQIFIVFGPMIFLVFCWSYVRTYNIMHPFVPDMPVGNVLLLSAIYAVGRIYRRVEHYGWLTARRAFIWLSVGFLLGFLRVSPFASPISLVVAICALRLCREIVLPTRIEKVIMMIAPSMFPVLCYQATPYIYAHVPNMVGGLHEFGSPVVLALVIVALVFYLGGILLDVPRRLVVYWMRPLFERVCRHVDQWWSLMV